MLRYFVGIFICFCSIFCPTQVLALTGKSDLEERVRIRLAVKTEQWIFSGMDVRIQRKGDSIHRPGMSRWKITRKGKQWSVSSLGLPQEGFHFPIQTITIRGDFLRDLNGELPTLIEILPFHQKKFHLISDLSLRNYLVGVLAHEMPINWPLETLKAQAVAARSYALKTKDERLQNAWHLESTVADQVFRSSNQRQDLSAVRQAVVETDGVVLKDALGTALKAYYHADCGGHTVNASSVWGGGARGVATALDPQCPIRPNSKWTFQTSVQEFFEKLKIQNKKFKSIELVKDQGSERVRALRIHFQGHTKTISSNQVRMAIGPEKIKSTLFKMKQSHGDLVINGVGFGHGVGLCQWGSRFFGQKGYSFERILAHYYPNAKIQGL